MHLNILPLLFLTSQVIADGQKIVDAIEEIANTTTSLNQTVGSVSASPFSNPNLTPTNVPAPVVRHPPNLHPHPNPQHQTPPQHQHRNPHRIILRKPHAHRNHHDSNLDAEPRVHRRIYPRYDCRRQT